MMIEDVNNSRTYLEQKLSQDNVKWKVKKNVGDSKKQRKLKPSA